MPSLALVQAVQLPPAHVEARRVLDEAPQLAGVDDARAVAVGVAEGLAQAAAAPRPQAPLRHPKGDNSTASSAERHHNRD